MIKIKLAILCLLFQVTAFAQSAEEQYSNGIECNPAGSQIEMNACAGDDLDSSEKKLAATYTKLMNTIKFNNLNLAPKNQYSLRSQYCSHLYGTTTSLSVK